MASQNKRQLNLRGRVVNDKLSSESGRRSSLLARQILETGQKPTGVPGNKKFKSLSEIRDEPSTIKPDIFSKDETKLTVKLSEEGKIKEKKKKLPSLSEITPIDIEDVGPPEPETLPKLTFFNRVSELMKDPTAPIPFVGGAEDAVKFGKLLNSANKLRKDEADEEDMKRLRDFIRHSRRKRTFGYNVLDILIEVPAFAGELAATGGIYTAGRKATVKGAKKMLKKLLKEGGEELLEKKATKLGIKGAGILAGRSLQALASGATKIPARTLEKQVRSSVGIDEDEKLVAREKEDFVDSATKAFGEQWVETLSEFSGPLLRKLSKPIKNKLVKNALFGLMKKVNPAKGSGTLAKFVNRAGWHGIIPEIFEERVADVGHGLLEQVGMSDQKFKLPSARQLGTELVAFSVPGVAVAHLQKNDPELKKAKETVEKVSKKIKPGLTIEDISGIPDNLKPLAKEAQKYDTAEEFKEKSVKPFHTIKLHDLKQIEEKDNKVISPSFGITKSIKSIDKYGDITLVPSSEMLEETPFYTRDIWSATLDEVPDVIYKFDESSKAADVLSRYGFDMNKINKNIKGKDDPRDSFLRYYLRNSQSFDQNRIEIIKEMGWDYMDQEEMQDMIPEEIEEYQADEDVFMESEEYADSLNEDDALILEKRIAKMLYPEIKKTPDNISQWLKDNYKGEVGVGGIWPGSQYAAEKFDYKDLADFIDRLGKQNIDTSELLAKQQQAHIDAALELGIIESESEGQLGDPGYRNFDQKFPDEAAGTLARMSNTEEAIQEMPWLEDYNKEDIDNAIDILKEAYIDIPSEYFEGKSFEAFDINDFPAVVTSNQEAVGKLKDMGYEGEIFDDFKDFYNQATQKPTEAKVPTEALEALQPTKPLTGKKVKSAIRETTGVKRTSAWKKKRTTTLLKERIKNISRGAREGGTATRKTISDRLKEINRIVRKSNLSTKNKGKLVFSQAQLAKIKNEKTFQDRVYNNKKSLVKRIEKLEQQQLKSGMREKIKKEIKGIKPTKRGALRVSKFNYHSNKLLQELKDISKLNQKDALTKLEEMPDEDLSEIDKIKRRFASYQSNGAKSSLAMVERVLSDVRMIKREGKEAKNLKDLIKKINRREKVEELYSGIDEYSQEAEGTKGVKKVLKVFSNKFKSGYMRGFGILRSTLNAIAGKEMAEKYDPQLAENRKNTAAFNKGRKIMDSIGNIIGEEKEIKILGEIFDLASKDYTLIDKEGVKQEISKMEIIDIYNSLKNDLIKERYYNAYGQEQVDALIRDNLTNQDIKIADTLMENIQDYREVMNKRHIERTGRDLGFVQNYWPSTSEYKQDVFDDIKQQSQIPSAMKARAKSKKVVPKPVNAWMKTLRHIEQVEHTRHLSGKYEELMRLFTDRKIEHKIKNIYGEKLYEDIKSQIDKISLNRQVEKLDVISNTFNKALNNWVSAKIVSPTIFVRQIASTINYWEDMPAGEFSKYFLKGVKNPKKTFDFMWENVPFIEPRFNRGYSEALEDAIQGANQISARKKQWTNALSAMVRSGDITPIIYGGYSVIQSEMAKGKSMEEAIDVLEDRTIQSQQSPLKSSRSELQNVRNPFAKAFFRFKNTLSQYLRKEVDAMVAYSHKDISAKQLSKTTFIYAVVAPALYISLGAAVVSTWKGLLGLVFGPGGDEDDDESLAAQIFRQIVIQPFQAIPILDGLSEYAYREIADQRTYGAISLPLLDDIEKAVYKMGKEDISLRDVLDILSISQEPATGLPTESLKRYLIDYIPKEKSGIKGSAGNINLGGRVGSRGKKRSINLGGRVAK